MKPVMIGLALALAASSASARAESPSDAAFVQKAQADLLGQYALAVLARSHAANPQVQSFANNVAANAAAANRFLITYAKSHDIALTNQPSLRADSQYGSISTAKGQSFDHAFTQDIYVDTQLQESDFQTSVNDPGLKKFAQQQNQEMTALGDDAQKLGG